MEGTSVILTTDLSGALKYDVPPIGRWAEKMPFRSQTVRIRSHAFENL